MKIKKILNKLKQLTYRGIDQTLKLETITIIILIGLMIKPYIN